MMIGIPPGGDHLERAWPKVASILERAVAAGSGELTLGDLRRRIEGRRAQLWAWLDERGELLGCVVTKIDAYERQKVCRVWLGAVAEGREGHRDDWLLGLDTIECWAVHEGCAAIEVEGRPGWQKALNQDYRLKRVILRKEL